MEHDNALTVAARTYRDLLTEKIDLDQKVMILKKEKEVLNQKIKSLKTKIKFYVTVVFVIAMYWGWLIWG